VQDVENVLWDIIELRRLDVATGIQLDKLGGSSARSGSGVATTTSARASAFASA
jgi:hypothetical protein